MLSLRRFTSLARSYGGDLERWPEETRDSAGALLEISADARAMLEAAAKEDIAIGAARRREEAALWHPGEQDAALARLRSGVAGRIADQPRAGSARRWPTGALLLAGSSTHLGWLGLVTSSGFALAAGFLVGSLSAGPPASVNILAAFQTAPIQILAD